MTEEDHNRILALIEDTFLYPMQEQKKSYEERFHTLTERIKALENAKAQIIVIDRSDARPTEVYEVKR